MITIHVDERPFLDLMTGIAEEQIPYATSRALNDTTTDAQAAIRTGMKSGGEFLIRRDWVLDQIRVPKFSNKNDDPMRTVLDVSEKADFLDKFEQPGTKTSRVGSHVAVPIMARPSRGSIIMDGLRPKNLHLQRVGRAIRGDQRTFLVRLKSGREGIFQRVGPRKDDVQLLYWLTPSTPIPGILHFETTAERTIEKMWETNFRRRFDEAMRSAR